VLSRSKSKYPKFELYISAHVQRPPRKRKRGLYSGRKRG